MEPEPDDSENLRENIEEEKIDAPLDTGVLGDINGDGNIGTDDLTFLKGVISALNQ